MLSEAAQTGTHAAARRFVSELLGGESDAAISVVADGDGVDLAGGLAALRERAAALDQGTLEVLGRVLFSGSASQASAADVKAALVSLQMDEYVKLRSQARDMYAGGNGQ